MNVLERRMEEAYQHIKPYFKVERFTKELRKMCQKCDAYCGMEHDYSECRDEQCFKFFLCYEYMSWSIPYEHHYS